MTEIQEYLHSFNTLEDLKQDLAKNLLFFRENEDLLLVRYKEKENVSSFFRAFRGLILDKVTRDIVLFPLRGSNDLDDFQKNVSFQDCVVEESVDGTLINVFFYKNSWHVSTKGTLDANCKWSGQTTFKNLFLETLQHLHVNMSTWNKHFCYGFVLGHPDAQNVTWYEKPTLYHIYSKNMLTFKENNIDLNIPKPRILKLEQQVNTLALTSYDALLNAASKAPLPITTEGFMLFSKNRQYRVKVPFESFQHAKELKGNVTHPFYTLMRLIDSHQPFQDLLEYFPNYTVYIGHFQHAMSVLVPYLFDVYFKTKIQRVQYMIPKLFQKAIVEIHNDYKLRIHTWSLNITYAESTPRPHTTIHDVHFYITQKCDRGYVIEMLKRIVENNFAIPLPPPPVPPVVQEDEHAVSAPTNE